MRTLQEINELVGGRIVRGDQALRLTAVRPLDQAESGSISFVSKQKYVQFLQSTKASAVLLSSELIEAHLNSIPESVAILEVKSPYVAFAQSAQFLAAKIPAPIGVHPSSVVEPSAKIGKNVSLGPFAYVGTNARVGDGAVLYGGVHVEADASVGEGSILYNHVVIRHNCHVGAGCILHPGVVIGSDGFGFAPKMAEDGKDLEKLQHIKIPQSGNVVIENHVEIGSNSCVDRGALGTTLIQSGTKIDNLVQIGHNAELGKNCILVAQSGVAGSTKLGTAVTLAAQAGVAGHLSIGSGALILGQAGVAQDVDPGKKMMGTPALPATQFLRNSVYFGQLTKLVGRLNKLEKKIFSKDK